MPTATTKRSDDPARLRRDRVKARVKAEGFKSLYAMCREKRVDYQLARRAVVEGLKPSSTLHTVDELKRLGIYEDVAAA